MVEILFLSVARPESIQIIQDKSFAMELRLDLFPSVEIESIRKILQNSVDPIMLTLRKTSQGGAFQGTESEREILIERLLALQPPFFDLEYDMSSEFLQDIIKRYPKTKFLLSHHHFQETQIDWDRLYHSMQQYDVFGYKIAGIAMTTNDALKMLLFSKKYPQTSVICLGERGAFARVLGPVMRNLIDYACVDAQKQTGPGQLTVEELVDVYRYPSLNEETSIYGLIGDPVDKSLGHLYHNAVFRKRHLNAVYVKMIVKPEELSEFLSLAMALGMRGLSVTMPLKEKIFPFLDEMEPSVQQIGAVNTLLLKNGRIIGTNTDGLGALDAIEKRGLVHGKRIVLLGAGGAARAIAFEAKARGADVCILNRTVQRAKAWAEDMGCAAGGLDEVPSHYDILINCSSDPMPIDPQNIRPDTLAMDIVYCPRETPFLQAAALQKCQIIYGEEMFLNQAARQTAFWMGS